MFFHEMKMLERVFWLKRIKGSGNPMHEATSTSGSFVTDVVAPLKKLLLTLEPIQSGSGTPSPDNIRPISGHTEVNTQRTGKNLWSDDFANYSQPLDYRLYPIDLKQGETYTVSLEKIGSTVTGCAVGLIKSGDRYDNFVTPAPWLFINLSGAIVINRTATYVIDGSWTDPKLVVYCADESAFNSLFENYQIQLELGSTATDYEPYQGTTYTTSLGRTVYGGTLDVVSGELIVDKGYIASYNGESLPSTWISDRDEYASGTTPTFGAEVVYDLATPQTYQLTPQQINTLIGQNNIVTDDGVEVSEVVYMTRLVGSPLLGSPQTEEPTEETEEPEGE